ncbi:MAG: SDR family NAD(P)-dependent oxidoreductase, partial [Chloroflexi bacterium]|nr:SDR family NAD(P)-dependent oxidoreductase [Chloroflexota bacterium]
MDWAQVFVGEQRRRVVLPTYPFERQRYWIEPPTASPSVSPTTAQAPARRKADIGEWFSITTWDRSPRRAPPTEQLDRQSWIILLDHHGIGPNLAGWLEAHNQRVFRVYAARAYAAIGSGAYAIRPDVRDDYEAVLEDLQREGEHPRRIVHLWTVDDYEQELEQVLARGFYSLLALAQAMGERALDACRIDVLSTAAQQVTGSEALVPAKSTILGPCKVIAQEYANFKTRSIDIEPHTSAFDVVCELLDEREDDVVALRGLDRWIPSFVPVQLDPAPRLALRERGVYLITGGLGGLGLAIAEHLVKKVAARLVLIGRTALPPRRDWQHLLETQADDPNSRRIRAIQRLEGCGADVLVLQADVSDPTQMESAVRRATEYFGELHGVIHAAGVPGVGLIQFKTREAAAGVLAPKVDGTLALSAALRDRPLDFLVLFSSIASVTGGPGQADYAAANAFLDAWARCHADCHGRTISIGWGEWLWDAWQEGLQGFPAEVRRLLIASRETYGISFDEGTQALERALAAGRPHVSVTTQDLSAMVAGSRQATVTAAMEHVREQRRSQPAHPRPNLSNWYAEPGSLCEQQIAAVWSDALGIEPIGSNDNFFELGGNSLVGISVIARVRKELRLDKLPAHTLYDAPTVAALARHVEQQRRPAGGGHALPSRAGLQPRAGPRNGTTAPSPTAIQVSRSELAIVGMSGRFPAASSVEAFWTNLTQGVRSICAFTDQELLERGVDRQLLGLPNYVRAGTVLADVERFDAGFFGYPPREAEIMDPQHRMFLECAWEALERAAYDPESFAGPIGVFAGSAPPGYFLHHLLPNRPLLESAGDMQLSVGLSSDSLATRVS